ncbi:rab guanine nucleotide exchange factor S2 [Orbilia oligospora]|uniref:Rab guanine nucleotide exchange factor S2 n=1 Tax=Orbilia oligospora TaxID=2813651 RepID=A0A6G1MP18_ORBOL|nr:rab guanine nucleotide exchange factor S2 [Orbilia oligospora]KAF3263583.1 rab guanine nucleotide exchange factor S2 [Orbilia oligospora]
MPSALPSSSVKRRPSQVEIGSFSTISRKDGKVLSLSHAASSNNSTSDLHGPPSVTSEISEASTPEPAQQNLSGEVQALSDKLIKAINHQSSLEEGLEETRHELDVSKQRIKHLEAIAKEHQDMMATGVLVEKKEVEMETRQLMNKLMEESMQRGKAEKEKRHIEQDLENLTTSLFEEANKMVIAARKEREAVMRRNDQLEQQLSDTEILLHTHQEQLSELKDALQQMTAERDELEALSSPTTPALSGQASKESLNRIFEALHIPTEADEVSPSHPTHFSSILQPVLRSDISSFHDFCNVLHMSKHYAPPMPVSKSPAPTPSSGFSIMGFGNASKMSPLPSSSSFFGGHSQKKSVSSTTSGASAASAPVYSTLPPAPPLRETAFFKRALIEDIEPTLRLDAAPGISWIARRTVLTAVVEGTLVIEIMPPISKLPIFSCSMCGENRNDPEHARTHRFRTNETEAAQKYPLCGYCVHRLRSVCAFLAFLRTAKEGYIKCETEDDEKNAWEESVKLREQMFWSRVGGGVVPSFHNIREDILKVTSPRSPPPPPQVFEKKEPVVISVATPVSLPPKSNLRNRLSQVTISALPQRRSLPPALPPALPPRGNLYRGISTSTEKSVQATEEDIEASNKTSDAMSQTDSFKEKAESQRTTPSIRSRDSHLPSPPQSPTLLNSKVMTIEENEKAEAVPDSRDIMKSERPAIPGSFN